MRRRDIAIARHRAREAAHILDTALQNHVEGFTDDATKQGDEAAALMRKATARWQELRNAELRGDTR